MTTIIDPSVPSIDAGDAMLDRETSRSRLVVFAGTAAVTMTLLNLAAAAYFYRGIGELRSLERRLEQLSAFEGRIVTKVDNVNNGLQTRFETFDSNVQGRLAEIRDRLEKVERQVAPSGLDASLPPSADAAPDIADGNSFPVDEAAPELETSAEPPVAASPRRRPSMPAPSAAYQRMESAEGKVYYRKVKQ